MHSPRTAREHYLSLKEIIENFAHCRKLGMNYLFNVGPLASGALPPLERELLLRFGQWMQESGSGLCDALPSTVTAKPSNVFVMEKDGRLFGAVPGLGVKGNAAVTVNDDGSCEVTLSNLPSKIEGVHWIDNGEQLACEQAAASSCRITLTPNPYGSNLVVRIFRAEINRPE